MASLQLVARSMLWIKTRGISIAHVHVRKLPELDQPETMEITFGLKATGEVGNVAVARGVGEANYTITLTWKRETKDTKDEK